jgi:hypothetical protein
MADKKSETLKELDEAAIEEPTLVESVSDKLDSVFSDGTEDTEENDDEGGDEEVKADETPKWKEATPDEKPAAKAPDAEEKPTPEPKKDAEKTDEAKEYNLPDAYVRCAVHQGWKPEEVTEFFQKDPEAALRVLSNIHMTTNAQSKWFSDQGRAKKMEEPAPEPAIKYEPIDVAALKETYGDDPIVGQVVKMDLMLSKMATLINGKLSTIPARPADIDEVRSTNAKVNEVNAKIHGFFNNDGMKVYSEYYGVGDSGGKLTGEQTEHRLAVLKEADAQIAGAALHGEELSVADALTKAHLICTHKIRDQFIVNSIKAKVEKRGKSLSLKPSDSKKNALAEQANGEKRPKTAAEREVAVSAKLSKIFKEE